MNESNILFFGRGILNSTFCSERKALVMMRGAHLLMRRQSNAIAANGINSLFCRFCPVAGKTLLTHRESDTGCNSAGDD